MQNNENAVRDPPHTSSGKVSVPATLLNCFIVSKATQYLAISLPASIQDQHN